MENKKRQCITDIANFIESLEDSVTECDVITDITFNAELMKKMKIRPLIDIDNNLFEQVIREVIEHTHEDGKIVITLEIIEPKFIGEQPVPAGCEIWGDGLPFEITIETSNIKKPASYFTNNSWENEILESGKEIHHQNNSINSTIPQFGKNCKSWSCKPLFNDENKLLFQFNFVLNYK